MPGTRFAGCRARSLADLWRRRASRAPPRQRGLAGWSVVSQRVAPTVPLEGLPAGLGELGWVEGGNLSILSLSGDREQARALTAEMLAAKADVIVAQGPMSFGARGQQRTSLHFRPVFHSSPARAKLAPACVGP